MPTNSERDKLGAREPRGFLGDDGDDDLRRHSFTQLKIADNVIIKRADYLNQRLIKWMWYNALMFS